MMIEIKGVQFQNKGAELMLHAVLTRIKAHWPDAEVALEPNPRSDYLCRAKLGAYQKLSLRKNRLDLNFLTYLLPASIRQMCKRKWGVVTEADIDVVLDAAGFAYGDQWGSLKITHLGSELRRYHKHGKQYLFLPQAFGPFSRAVDVKTLKRDLPLASLIVSRDDISYKHMRALHTKGDNLTQFPDFTNGLQGVVPDYFDSSDNVICFVPNNNMVGSRNESNAWRENYMRVMTTLMQSAIQSGYQVVLLNHEGPDDRAICESLNQALGGDIQIIEEPDPIKVKGILGQCKAVVCSRFHGCVSALSQGVPCLGTSWSHKYEKLYEEYGVSELLLAPDSDSVALSELLNDVLSNQSWHQVLQEKSKHYKGVTESMWKTVFETVEAKSVTRAS